MRPSVDIDKSLHGTITELAEVRYGGDKSKAYNEILKRGLEYTTIPAKPEQELENKGNSIFIKTRPHEPPHGTQEFSPPIVFHRNLSRHDSLLEIDCYATTSIEFKELEESLKLISRYPDVKEEKAAFGIRRKGGIWVGWGFKTCISALTDPRSRYHQSDFDTLETENLGLVFEAGRDYFLITGTPEHSQDLLSGFQISIYRTPRRELDDDLIKGILGEFDGSIGPDSKISGAYHTYRSRKRIPLDINKFTCAIKMSDSMKDVAVAKNAFEKDNQRELPPGTTVPEELVVYLRDHTDIENAADRRFQIEKFGITDTHHVRNYSIQAEWFES